MTKLSALEIWKEKLAHLQAEEFIASDASVIFNLGKKITEAKRKIAELEVEGEVSSAPPPNQRIAPSRLPRGAQKLFGREQETAMLDRAWEDLGTHVVTLVAWGGVGKSALVAAWQGEMARRGFDGADYFDWSFYSQGTRDGGGAPGEIFVTKALEFFGDGE
ncbi:MAG: ATP-binding protein, partial [Acidobacteria bacterium]|nr:ATP-binding protein [Acidobacteriota bacterium]